MVSRRRSNVGRAGFIMDDLSIMKPDNDRAKDEIMLRRVSGLKGYQLQATDGWLGSVSDLLFDDVSWKTRWIVVDTGKWLSGRRVLLHPSAIGKPNDPQKLLPVDLTKERVEASPEIYEDRPVSQQMQTNLSTYYGWEQSWPGQYPIGSDMGFRNNDFNEGGMEGGDPHLRSVAAVTGYHIHAADGDIGHVESFLVDDEGWDILYLVIDTGNWWQGDHVLVSPAAVANIDWLDSKVHLRVTRQQWASPASQAAETLTETDRQNLYSHYKWDE